jgi:hypothetical protein
MAISQDIEARRWTPLPVGTNIVGLGHIHADGEIFFDPVIKIEDPKYNTAQPFPDLSPLTGPRELGSTELFRTLFALNLTLGRMSWKRLRMCC